MLNTLIANAVKLSGATKGHVRQLDGEFLRVLPTMVRLPKKSPCFRADRDVLEFRPSTSRAFSERKAIQIADATAERGPSSLADKRGAQDDVGNTVAREGTAIGVIVIWRDIVEPFTERQVALVETFADQAVIAIENVRLFKELKESLEQQTATSEILGVIAQLPDGYSAGAGHIAENAARVCGAA